MYSAGSTRALPRVGFPIRKSPGQRLVSTSPGLIAAAHVLHRLLAPRHPPCALVLLIRREPVFHRYGVFKVRAGRRPPNETAHAVGRHRGLSKLNSVLHAEVDVVSRRARASDGRSHLTSRVPTGVRAPVFPRKEVIQPQLPLRLPCYDFTPIIDPTFDGSLPCGLGHRLRVLPTFVV
jgi:hypothetical protein